MKKRRLFILGIVALLGGSVFFVSLELFTCYTQVAPPKTAEDVALEKLGLPSLDKLAKGTFDKDGMAAVFEKVTGLMMPDDVQPISGDYVVFDEDYNNANQGKSLSRSYHAYFSAPPTTASRLIGEIQEQWKLKYISQGEWVIYVSEPSAKAIHDGQREYAAGTISIAIQNPYHPVLVSYSVHINPINGFIRLNGSNSRNESIRSRQEDERERRAEELEMKRDQEAEARANAQWDTKIRKLAETSDYWKRALQVHEAKQAEARKHDGK